MTTIAEQTNHGLKAEDTFQRAFLETFNISLQKSSRKNDIEKHYDFFYYKEGQLITIEVKSVKKEKRYDDNFNYDWLWLEFRNVRGKAGWLYGQAMFIAFEMKDHFILVSRGDLIALAEELVNKGKIAPSPDKAKYICYTRPTRKDLISQIETSTLETIYNKKIKKPSPTL